MKCPETCCITFYFVDIFTVLNFWLSKMVKYCNMLVDITLSISIWKMWYFWKSKSERATMILPTKHLNQDRALLGVGAEILCLLTEPKTVSRLWDELKSTKKTVDSCSLTYDWFVLSLDFLFTLNVIELEKGLIRRVHSWFVGFLVIWGVSKN